MPRPYSTDLRECVASARADGRSCREVAHLFNVSASSVVGGLSHTSGPGRSAPTEWAGFADRFWTAAVIGFWRGFAPVRRSRCDNSRHCLPSAALWRTAIWSSALCGLSATTSSRERPSRTSAIARTRSTATSGGSAIRAGRIRASWSSSAPCAMTGSTPIGSWTARSTETL